MSLTNYNGIEASNLFLGQGGSDMFTGVSGTQTPPSGVKRWVGVQIIANVGISNDITINCQIGDNLTLPGAAIDDLIGTVIYGPIESVDPNGHTILCIRG